MVARQASQVLAKRKALTSGDAVPAALPRSFYARPSTVVARDILGRVLVRKLGDAILMGRIVEAEAYQQDDPASHSFRGLRPRTQVMFGPPGHLYVYFTYGMHFCMNVVTGQDGEGSAVLLRAAEPLEGLHVMRKHRGLGVERLLCSGPARLTQSFAIGREHNGLDLIEGGELFLSAGRPLPSSQVGVGPRIGIRSATEKPWRFHELGNQHVSRVSRVAPGDATPLESGTPKGRGAAKAKSRGKATR